MKPGIAIALLAGVGAFLIASNSKSSSLPRIPPLPGKVPPIPPAPPSPSPPSPPADPSGGSSVFVQPNDPGGSKTNTPKTSLHVGSLVQIRGIPNQIYRIFLNAAPDQYSGEALDPIAFNAGALVGVPNSVINFNSADVVAILQGDE